MKLIVGLGNPGNEYKKTRHNVGFMVLDELASDLNVKFNSKKDGALYAELNIESEKVILMKPQKYINLSGEVIKSFIQYYKIDVSDILIVSDDLDMEVGTYKLKLKGSSGGHNGLKNIEKHLNTTEYKRLKIGISNNKRIDTKDYVLGNFSKEESKIIEKVILRSKDIIKDYVKLDFIKLMNKYNGLQLEEE